MWDRMLQHFHKSTPPAHIHGMLEHCIQHLPLQNTNQLPLNTCIYQIMHTTIQSTHTRTDTVHSHNTVTAHIRSTYQKQEHVTKPTNQN
ncbi:hypothetical protein QL285_091009 [Trifolium repens]|nr:hypothetical protein QL285_091009 [Trifolium repens]